MKKDKMLYFKISNKKYSKIVIRLLINYNQQRKTVSKYRIQFQY